MELAKLFVRGALALARKIRFDTQAPQPDPADAERLKAQALRSL